MGGFSMERFELQKPISQLFGALKSHFLECEPPHIGRSEQLNKTHYFRKIIFVTSSLYHSMPKGNLTLAVVGTFTEWVGIALWAYARRLRVLLHTSASVTARVGIAYLPLCNVKNKNWRAPSKRGVCTYFVAIFQVARNPLKFGMPTLFVLRNVPAVFFFSTSGQRRLQARSWKSLPRSPSITVSD